MGQVNNVEVPKKHLDLYVSGQPDSLTGWAPPVCLTDGMQNLPEFQTMALLWDVDEHGQRRSLYLLGFDNRAPQQRTQEGPNTAYLYSVTLPADPQSWSAGFALREVDTEVFQCTAEYANMDAASGVYVSPTRALTIYSADHYIRPGARNSELMQFEEFATIAPIAAGQPVATLEDSRIELFDAPGCTGRPLLFSGRHAHIDDLSTLRVGGKPFGKQVSSIRYLIPAGFVLVLYHDLNQKGRPLVLPGDGHSHELPDLTRYGFGDVTRSCALVAERVARTFKRATWV
jgi:hypothetical protein